jgi:hypothetical protein
MALQQTDNNSISFVLDNTIHIGDDIVYKLIMNNGQFNSEQIVTKKYGDPQTIFFENGNSTTNFNSTNWSVTNAEFYSASSSITDSPVGNYGNNENNTIELTNSISLVNMFSAYANFYAKWDIESGWDYVQFEISTDNGTSWIPQCGKYTKNGNSNQGILNQPMYDGTKSDWINEVIDLSDYLGQTIKFRFKLLSDGNTTGDGFYFDDFEVKTISNSASVIENDLFNVSIYPNPATHVLHIEIPNLASQTGIKIYSINGQLIKQVKTSEFLTKINLNNFSKGIYFVSLHSNNIKKSYKFIIQ